MHYIADLCTPHSTKTHKTRYGPTRAHLRSFELEMNALYEFLQVQLVFVKTSFNAQVSANGYEDVCWESIEFLYDNLTHCHSTKGIMDGQWCCFVSIA